MVLPVLVDLNEIELPPLSVMLSTNVNDPYTFKSFGPLENIKPLVIRLDIPLFLNRAPASDDNFVQMRWLIGINRAF